MAKKIKRRLAAISQRRELLGYIQNHLHTNIHALLACVIHADLFCFFHGTHPTTVPLD